MKRKERHEEAGRGGHSWIDRLGIRLFVKFGLTEKLPNLVFRIQRLKAAAEEDPERARERTIVMLGRMLLSCGAILLLTFIFALISGSAAECMSLGICGAIAVVGLPVRKLDQTVKKKRLAILIELPELIDKLTLLILAGEHVRNAILHCAEHRSKEAGHSLYRELNRMANALSHNISFQKAMEEFAKRCSLQETTVLTTTILLNEKRGGEELAVALNKLSSDMWDKRKTLSRTLGEEASSKLVFPMVLMFFVLMILIAVPAVLFMN